MESEGSPTLQNLPFDIKDYILTLLDSPQDLLSFSLSSKEWASLIIPTHIEYRELRIRANRSAVWKHLAMRADLAKNVRSLRLMSSKDKSLESFPLTLVPATAAQTVTTRPLEVDGVVVGQLQNKRPLPEMVKAIEKLGSLENFTWISSDGHGEVVQEVFKALGRCQALTVLRLGNIIVDRDHLGPNASLWRLSNLTELVLLGKEWSIVGQPDDDEGSVDDSLISMLDHSPNLESLTMTYSRLHPRFTFSPLKSLRKLHLSSIPSLDDTPDTDLRILDFLQAHPSIEDLKWYPVNERMVLPRGLLPNLKCIYTKHAFATVLLRDTTLIKKRKMECISQISLGRNTILLMGQIDASRLLEVHLWRYDGLDAIKQLAEMCPSIQTLLVPNFGLSYAEEIDDCIECLARFPNLEAVLESALWLAIRLMKVGERTEFIARFLTLCPKLRRISHWVSLSNMVHDIVFERSLNGSVTWREVPSKDDWI